MHQNTLELDDEDPDPRLRLGKTLLKFGKVYHRHIEPHPAWFLERQSEVTQYRTTAQVRRGLKPWMVKSDRELFQKYKAKSLRWGTYLSSIFFSFSFSFSFSFFFFSSPWGRAPLGQSSHNR